MTIDLSPFARLSDADLLAHVRRAVVDERRATVQLIALLMELDARRLYLAQGCSSLFTYCTQVLHLSEHAAYGRIEATRAARRFPLILERLREGALTLTAVGLLAPHLTPDNHLHVLDAARHKSKREVEVLVAHLRPQSDAPAVVRKLPTHPAVLQSLPDAADTPDRAARLACAPPAAPPVPRQAAVKPLTPERYKIQFTMSRDTHDKLRRAQDLLRHAIPNGDTAAIFDRALSLLIDHLEKTKCATGVRPRRSVGSSKHSRYIPAAVKRAVWKRDGGRCAFVGPVGRCTETGFLEFHHVVPFAAGGATSTENLQLRCRCHNAYEAECHLGLRQPLFLREVRDAYG